MYVVLCNCPPASADAIARPLVEEGLAACVNVIPAVTSYFQWKGKLEVDAEATLLIKVPAANLDALSKRIRELHTYETVEILALPVDAERSDPGYVAWVRGFARR